MSVVTVTDLSKSYGDKTVLDGLSFEVDGSDGQIIGVLGPNGVGKTTLLEILTGQRPQDSGEATVLSHSVPEDSLELKYDVGILPEKEAPPSFLTPREFLAFVGQERDLEQELIESEIQEWSDLLQFTDVLDTLGSDLSRGQQQKVMIAQAFLHSPKLVFIDEPLTNLDPIIQAIFIERLQDYSEEGNTIIVSTHQVNFALTVCSELHLLTNDGDHVKVDDPHDKSEDEIIDLLRTDR